MNGKRILLRYRGTDPLRQRLALLYCRRNQIDEIIRSLERYRRLAQLVDTLPEKSPAA